MKVWGGRFCRKGSVPKKLKNKILAIFGRYAIIMSNIGKLVEKQGRKV